MPANNSNENLSKLPVKKLWALQAAIVAKQNELFDLYIHAANKNETEKLKALEQKSEQLEKEYQTIVKILRSR